MTKVTFFGREKLTGFLVTGHCTTDEFDLDGKLVCSAVSSAVYMAANTITEVCGSVCDITERDGYLKLTVKREGEGTQTVLSGLRLHLQQLASQYSNIELNLEV